MPLQTECAHSDPWSLFRSRRHAYALLALAALTATVACKRDGRAIEVVMDRPEAERLLRFYFGGLTSDAAEDPVAAGLLSVESGRFHVHAEGQNGRHAPLWARIMAKARGAEIAWDSLATLLDGAYYHARGIPSSVEALRARWPYLTWLRFDVHGPMTSARRHVFVPEQALRSALGAYHERGRRLTYPVGTAIVAEHHAGGVHAETTAMIRRADGFWDFATYGADGELAEETLALPKALSTPRQCLGCHLGAKAFEPERSFPGQARAGPDGPRAYFVDEALRDEEVTRYFEEHRRRSDTVLGVYATLYAAQLRARRRAGTLAPEDSALLGDLGL